MLLHRVDTSYSEVKEEKAGLPGHRSQRRKGERGNKGGGGGKQEESLPTGSKYIVYTT